MKHALLCLKNELVQASETAPDVENKMTDNGGLERKRKKNSELWEALDNEMSERIQIPRRKSTSLLHRQIRDFFALPCEPRYDDPLEWWTKKGKLAFPELFKLAKTYLTIPATSVASKRVFPSAGEIISARRSRINDSTARMLVCLHGNLR